MATKLVVNLTSTASVCGKTVTARGLDRLVYAFLGVPYAAPPVGERKFQPPAKLEYWTGTKDATKHGPICPQDYRLSEKSYYPFPVPEDRSEDCLHLNIYTPDPDPKKKYPVMFWLHGGSFTQGFSNFYDGTALAAYHDVVFVSINYRLNALGFLCTGEDGVVNGNAGLLDQIAALQWVQQHIAKFGGDPDNVTIFGESAGGISVSHLIVTHLADGLFHRGISMSGVSTHHGSLWTQQQAGKFLRSRLKKTGFTSSDGKDIVKHLKTMPSDDLAKLLGAGISPVYDHYFFKEMPETCYNKQQFKPVDHIIGFNSSEGAQFVFSLTSNNSITSKEQARDFVKHVLEKMFYRGVPNASLITQAVIEKYVNCKEDAELMQSLVEMYGDLLFVAASVDVADKHSAKGRTFVYLYDHRPSMSLYPEWVRADHSVEVPLVIGEPYLNRFPDVWTEEEKVVSMNLMRYWTNFAKTGNPNSQGLAYWPPYTSSCQDYLIIKPQPEVALRYSPENVKFWSKTVPEIIDSNSKL